ncbi:MAG: TlpA family protein disulfide reductase [Proteobacteria bacterium]|nr:TlpA family protein disulfide reductase [Pseudomonadota bacterium]
MKYLFSKLFLIYSLPLLTIFFCSCNKEQEANVESTLVVKEVAAASAEPSFTAGSKAIDFTLIDLQGKKYSLADFKGKVVLFNFWATWCVPCVAEMPALERLYKTLKDKNFEIVAVSVDPADDNEKVEKFLTEKGITFKILRDPELELAQKYQTSGFPETFFISKNGEFLNFQDPEDNKEKVRVIADRAWDSKNFIDAVSKLLSE